MGRLIDVPNMLLVGSTARNTGKTTFCLAFLERWKNKFDIIGLKVTNVRDGNGICHHGNEGCGVCASFAGNYEIIEEADKSGEKDTQKLLAAGAKKVFWLKAVNDCVEEALNIILSGISKNSIILCESNSLSEIVRPGVSLLMRKSGITQVKPSAALFIEKADFVADISEPGSIEAVLDKIEVSEKGVSLAVSKWNSRFRSHG